MDEKERKAGYDLLYLLSCEINGIVPDLDKVKQMNLEQVRLMSKKHMVTVIACMALEQAYGGKLPDADVCKQWKRDKIEAIYISSLQESTKKEVLDFLEENGIWHMVLKGSVLKELYPRSAMREMADVDILYDSSYQRTVFDWFIKRGFAPKVFGERCEDVYNKAPFLSIEMHNALFGKEHKPLWVEHYRNVKKKLIHINETNEEYRFTDDDFYVYSILHAYKHYHFSGTGFRTLMDSYVFLKSKKDKLNWLYVDEELRRLEIEKWEKQFRRLSRKVFSFPFVIETSDLTDEEKNTIECLMESGAAGTEENLVAYGLKKIAGENEDVSFFDRIHYLVGRFYPGRDYFEKTPERKYIYNHKWLMPGFLIYRAIHKLTVEWRSSFHKIVMIFKAK